MKKNLVNTVFFVLILMWVPTGLEGQSMVASVGVDKENIDLRGAVQVLDSVTINTFETGIAVLRFDGYCKATPGDKIFIAVSNTKVWGACDENINLEVPNDDVNTAPFSHTRVFELEPGDHTFYAVAHNHIELNGSGIASVYGNLLLRFFGTSDPEIISFREISTENKNVRGHPYLLTAANLITPESGKVHVSFDGLCISSTGDLITLAASDETDWASFNGGVLVEAISGNLNGNSFSHSKVYEVGPGSYTFYALAENIQKYEGNGRISVFGSLTAIYYPDKIKTDILFSDVMQTNINVRNADRVLDEISINSQDGGEIMAQFNGMVSIQPGDRIVFDIENGSTIPAGNSNISLESYDADRPYRSFSHTQLFSVPQGQHTISLLARNRDEMDGSGSISISGTFNVVYEGSDLVSGSESGQFQNNFFIAPNPAVNRVALDMEQMPPGPYTVIMIDINGRAVCEMVTSGEHPIELDLSSYTSGMYFIRVIGNNKEGVKPLVITK